MCTQRTPSLWLVPYISHHLDRCQDPACLHILCPRTSSRLASWKPGSPTMTALLPRVLGHGTCSVPFPLSSAPNFLHTIHLSTCGVSTFSVHPPFIPGLSHNPLSHGDVGPATSSLSKCGLFYHHHFAHPRDCFFFSNFYFSLHLKKNSHPYYYLFPFYLFCTIFFVKSVYCLYHRPFVSPFFSHFVYEFLLKVMTRIHLQLHLKLALKTSLVICLVSLSCMELTN